MAIQDDFTIYPDSKVIRHTSGTGVWTMTQFHSYLMDTFDEPGYLTYETPIKFNTPTSFTMINGWFLDNGDGSEALQFLTAGGLDTLGYDTVSDPIYMMDLDTRVAEILSTDLDLDVRTNDTDTQGPLLSFKIDYPADGQARVWFRDVNSIGAPGAGEDFDVPTGTGDYTNTTGAAALNGDEIYHNVFTIATFAGTPDPQVYMYQNHPEDGSRTRIAEWSNLTNWDRGSIDVLVPVQLGGALVDSGNVTTFVRQTGDSFTLVESTFNAAGRTGIATETAADTVNITKGEYYLFYDGATPTPTFTAGDIIQDVATGGASPPTWYAEVVAHTSWSGGATGVLTIRGYRGAVSDTDNIFNGASDSTANVNGTGAGDTWVEYDAETTTPIDGDRDKPVDGATSTAERILKAFQDDTGAGKLLLAVHHPHTAVDGRTYTGTTRNLLYKDFVDDDVITAATGGSALLSVTIIATPLANTLISGYSDVTVAHVNGTVVMDTPSGTFQVGERVTWAGGGPALVVAASTTEITLANVEDETALNGDGLVITGDVSSAALTTDGTGGMTDENTELFNFSLSTAYDYSVVIEGGSLYEAGRSLSDIYAYLQYYIRDGQDTTYGTIYQSDGSAITLLDAEEYIKSDSSYSTALAKNAPFGTLAGSSFFGKQGVWLEGMASADDNNITLIEHLNSQQEPLVSISLTITNTRQDDRVAVYLEDGTTELPLKTQYTSHNTANVQSDNTLDRDATNFPNDTPLAGSVTIVDDSANEEHRYRYDSFATTVLTLAAEITDTSTGGGTQQLIDTTGRDFGGADDVVVGDIVRQTTDGGWGYVTAVTSSTELAMTLNSAGSTWDTKGYEINSLVVTYDNNDTFFIPYIDAIEDTGSDITPGTITDSVTYVSDREVVIEARNVQNSSFYIVPFKTTGTINNTGISQSIIRTEDTVYT